MSHIYTAREDIAMCLDAAHAWSAQLFIEAARRQLAPFNLKRHHLQFITSNNGVPALAVKTATGPVSTRWWWELGRAPHPPGSVLQAIAEIGATLDDDVPEAVAHKLASVVL